MGVLGSSRRTRIRRQQILAGTMIGRAYLERSRHVVVLVRWGTGGGPSNVLIRREDGALVARPFRGLRKPPISR